MPVRTEPLTEVVKERENGETHRPFLGLQSKSSEVHKVVQEAVAETVAEIQHIGLIRPERFVPSPSHVRIDWPDHTPTKM